MKRLLFLLVPLMLLGQRKPLILDASVGDSFDTSLAVFAAVGAPGLDLKAITPVGLDPDSRVKLAVKLLTVMAKRGVPVGWGAPEPLQGIFESHRTRQFEMLAPSDAVPADTKRAGVLIADTLQANAARTVIVAPDALTNVALALKLDPRLKGKIEQIILTEAGEKLDPVAAEVVKRSGVTIVRLVENSCKLDEENLGRLRAGVQPHFVLLARLADLDPTPVLSATAAVAYAIRASVAEPAPGRDGLRVNCVPLLAVVAGLVR